MHLSARLLVLYPFLYAAVRVLHLADENAGAYSLGDLLLILAVTSAVVGAIWAVVTLAMRAAKARGNGQLVALITFLLVLGLSAREPVRSLGIQRPLEPWHIASAVTVAVAAALLVWWSSRNPHRLHAMSVFLTLTWTLLTLRMILGIALDRIQARNAVSRSELARQLIRPIPGPLEAPRPLRDIYLLVLDQYASAAVLREQFGFDNSAFQDSLRSLGFHIPVVQSNYTETIHSLPSLLGAAHVHRAGRELAEGTTDPTLLRYVLERSRVVSFLKHRGYRFVFFPPAWWQMTRSNPLADSVVRVWSGFNLHWAASRTELRRAVLRETMLQPLHDHWVVGDHARLSLEEFGRLPSIQVPVFGFAHVISPHGPFVFDRWCGKVPRLESGDPKRYIGQLECLNQMVLRLVTDLLRDSAVPPVILLQGDHGTDLLNYHAAPCAARISPAAARERLGAFGAYYLPDGGAAAFGDTVTVVNVLGHVLRYYFRADLSPEPDNQYVVVRAAPFEFLRVEPAWLGGSDPKRPASAAGEACR
jgi:hypothetical protein